MFILNVTKNEFLKAPILTQNILKGHSERYDSSLRHKRNAQQDKCYDMIL